MSGTLSSLVTYRASSKRRDPFHAFGAKLSDLWCVWLSQRWIWVERWAVMGQSSSLSVGRSEHLHGGQRSRESSWDSPTEDPKLMRARLPPSAASSSACGSSSPISGVSVSGDQLGGTGGPRNSLDIIDVIYNNAHYGECVWAIVASG